MTPEQLTSEQLFELHAAHIASNERLFAAIEVLHKDLPESIGNAMRSAHVAPQIEIQARTPCPDARPDVQRATKIIVALCVLNLITFLILYAIK